MAEKTTPENEKSDSEYAAKMKKVYADLNFRFVMEDWIYEDYVEDEKAEDSKNIGNKKKKKS